MNEYILQEIVDGIVECADELCTKGKDKLDHMDFGQLLAYAEALSIIQSACSGEDLKRIHLDFDVDKKYLIA